MNALEHYVSGEYLDSHPEWHEALAPYKAAKVVAMLRRQHFAPTTFYDIGCGSGGILDIVSREYPDCRCVGFDVAPAAIALAKRRERENLSFRVGMPEDQAHVVMCLDVMEHVEDYLGFLRQVRGAGQFQLYNIPLDLSVRYVLQKSLVMKTRAADRHLHYFFMETAVATLEDSGHEVLDYMYASPSIEWGQASALRAPLTALRKALFAVAPDFTVRLMGGFSMYTFCRTGGGLEQAGAVTQQRDRE